MFGRRDIRQASKRLAKTLVAAGAVMMLCVPMLLSSGCAAADKAAEGLGNAAYQASGALGSSAEKGETSGDAFKAQFRSAGFDSSKASGDSKAAIDTSSADKGYVAARAKSEARLKFQVSLNGQACNYDLPKNGTSIVCPLNMGSGTYHLSILQNTGSNRYATLYSASVTAQIADETAPYLIPSAFCSYTQKSDCVAKARELTENAGNQGDALESIYDYVVENISYDKDKAAELAGGSGYIPDPDETLATRKGICLDYASLTAAMLRSVGIPCKIVTGYVSGNDIYHAWNMVYIDGTWRTTSIDVESRTWTRLDPTLASAGSLPTVGDGSGYTDRYQY